MLATATRPGGPLSPFQNQALWSEASSLTSNPLNIPGSRYGDIKPPGSSWYSSLGTLGRPPLINHYDSSSGNGNSYAGNRQTIDLSNMCLFFRDVSQILLDDGSALRELWAGMNRQRLKMTAAAVERPADDTASALSSHADLLWSGLTPQATMLKTSPRA